MDRIGCYENYLHFYHVHEYKNPSIYQSHLNDGGWGGCILRPISTSTTTINTLSVILIVTVADIVRPTYSSTIITPNITSYIFIKTITGAILINRYMQQSKMVTWVMVGRSSGLGHISTSTITLNSFLHIAKGRMAGLFRPISTSAIIKNYITPLVTIITTSISSTVTIIVTDITSIGAITTIY